MNTLVSTSIKNIIFDFGNVLIEWNPDNFYLTHFNNNHEAMNKFYQETNIQVLNLEMDRGVPFDNIINNLIVKHPEHTIALQHWKKSWHKMLGNNISGSIEILQALHKNNYNLYGLTNWSAETFPYVYYTHDFFHLFEDIVVSGREKVIKPDPKIFEICLTRNNINASQAIFIDDNLDNINAAQRLGIHSIHFSNPQQLQQNLIKLGVKL